MVEDKTGEEVYLGTQFFNKYSADFDFEKNGIYLKCPLSGIVLFLPLSTERLEGTCMTHLYEGGEGWDLAW